MNTISRGIRNAFRNTIRTISIVLILGLSIGLSLTMLLARQAVQSRIDTVKSSIGNTITIAPAGARGFEGGGEPLTTASINAVKTLAHVSSVTEILQARLTTTDSNLVSAIEAGSLGRRNNANGSSDTTMPPEGGPTGARGGSFTPPVQLTGVSSISNTALVGGGTLSLKSGENIDPSQDEAVAMIGSTLATKNNLSVGSTFTAYATTVTVKGIYDAGNNFSNNTVIMPLATVQRLSDQAGEISTATVQIDSIDHLDAATTSIKSTLGTTADVTNQQDTSAQALEPLENIKTISLYSLIGSVIAGAVIILLSMMMIVRERRREIGVLKAIGSSNVQIMIQFVVEAVTFTLLAVVIGIAIGAFAANPVTSALVSSSSSSTATQGPQMMGMRGGGAFNQAARLGTANLRNIQASVGWSILLYGLGSALVIAILGSAIPAWLIAKVRPAEVMRAE